ncbi:MAG: peptidoglycan-binding protein [Pyrinomonadaceae bacterium]|nr:peptidoglycan-binding protein [Pyrinomonadaceae bacterium]
MMTKTRLMKRFLSILMLFALATPALMFGSSGIAQADVTAEGETPEAAQYAMDWRVTGPNGGDVRALVVDPNDPQRFYFGTLDGQIYTSTDGGEQWRLLSNFNRPKLFMDHIIVDPRDSRTLYVATHRHKEPGGFFKSTNGGATWREAPELKEEALHSMTQSEKNPDMIIVGSNRGIWVSMDSGDSWRQMDTSSQPGLINVESLAIDPRNPDVIYAGTWYLPYKTTDGGRTWHSTKNGIIDDSDIFAIDIDPRNPDHVIASACSGIYETRNAGTNWRKVQGIPSQSRRTRAILQHPSVAGVVFAGTTEGFWRSTNGGESWMLTTSKQLEINSITVHPKTPDTIYIGTNNYGVMVSRDGGKSFAPTNGGYSGRFANNIVPDREQPDRVYASTINTATGGGFFFISNDGGMTWQPSMRNMPNRLITYSILQDERDGNIIYLGTNMGVYRSLDRGASWSPIGAPKAGPAEKKKKGGRSSSSRATAASRRPDETVKRAQEALNAAGYDVGTPDGAAGTRTIAAVRKFQADKGIPVSGKLDDATLTALGLGGGIQTSTASGRLPSPAIYLSDPINALATTYDDRDGRPGILAATNAGLYRTFDPTMGWEKLSYGQGIDERTTCISTTYQNQKTIWVGTATSGVLVSRDSGATWQQVEGIPTAAPISAIEKDKKQSAHIYVGTKQALWFSHDGGEKWIRRGGNLPYGDYVSILINPQNSKEIIVGNAYQSGGGGNVTINSGGVYRSVDGGYTWLRIDPRNAGLPSQRIWALAFDSSNPDKIFVGSHSAGIYVAWRGARASAGGSLEQ